MVSEVDISGKLAIDANNLNQLKRSARDNSPEALRAVAQQFEAILMNMMLKSMREATPKDGVFDNEQSRMFTSMLDQQLSTDLTKKGLGLADVLVRQLSKTTQTISDTVEDAVDDVTALMQRNEILRPVLPSQVNQTDTHEPLIDVSNIGSKIGKFVNTMVGHAKLASKMTGLPAHLMLGQAALETGWGKREINGQNGEPSYNLFGIKATGNWKGKVVEATTTEYIDGVKQKRIEKFRAYDSYAESFQDFANLIKNTPRYKNVMNNIDRIDDYANAMQSAGYATDPSYAKKLANVIKQIVQ